MAFLYRPISAAQLCEESFAQRFGEGPATGPLYHSTWRPLQENASSRFGVFPMSVPSLPWSNDHFTMRFVSIGQNRSKIGLNSL